MRASCERPAYGACREQREGFVQQRCRDLHRFVNFYNTVKPHSSLKSNTPFEVLETYFTQPVV
ncbi:hypothetical protein BV913_02560 [Neisseria dumasiana]|uniref:Integrase catalytic domain-containing protein n=1 Tax=Neisseria dumasiana TaxID=1931275 RepID=A0ABX3WNG6_9NEIS|nr:hypothetical protein BV913_02560 [Neisseria dumasiana]